MSDEFFASESPIDITFYFKMVKTKSGRKRPIRLTKEEYDEIFKTDPDKVQVVNTKWKEPSWGLGNEMVEQAMDFNYLKNEKEFNRIKYRSCRLKKLLVWWDLKDDKGEIRPCNEDEITKLNEDIAIEFMKEFDLSTTEDEEIDRKN